jgi:RNA polymerase-binding transcription factor DksA
MVDNKMNTQLEKLEAERVKTLQKLTNLRETLKSEVDPEADEGDWDLVEHEKAVTLVRSLERKLAYALQQARKGRYGICERCGKSIDPARLEAVPETTLCLNCKRAAEQRIRLDKMVVM